MWTYLFTRLSIEGYYNLCTPLSSGFHPVINHKISHHYDKKKKKKKLTLSYQEKGLEQRVGVNKKKKFSRLLEMAVGKSQVNGYIYAKECSVKLLWCWICYMSRHLTLWQKVQAYIQKFVFFKEVESIKIRQKWQSVFTDGLSCHSEQRQGVYDIAMSLDNKLYNHSLSSRRTRH